MRELKKLQTFDSKASLGSFSSDIRQLLEIVQDRIEKESNANRFNYIKFYALGIVGKDLSNQLNCFCNSLLCENSGIRNRVPNRIFRWTIQDCHRRSRLPPIPLRHLLLDFSKYCLELQKWKVDYKEIKKIAFDTMKNYIRDTSLYNIMLPINLAIDYKEYPQQLRKKIKHLNNVRYRPIFNLSCNMSKQKDLLKYKGSIIDTEIFNTYIKNKYLLNAYDESKMEYDLNELELRKQVNYYADLLKREQRAHSITLDAYDSIIENLKRRERALKSPKNEQKIESLRVIGYGFENKLKGMSIAHQMKLEEMQFFDSEIVKAKNALLLERQALEEVELQKSQTSVAKTSRNKVKSIANKKGTKTV